MAQTITTTKSMSFNLQHVTCQCQLVTKMYKKIPN